jgi:hypothetical protein
MHTVYAILDDGPAAGRVTEVGVNDMELAVIGVPGDNGTHCYKRVGWFKGDGHYVARFKYTKSLVI